LEGFLRYFRDYWLINFPRQAAHVLLIAVVFELLVFLINRFVLRRLMAPILRRDVEYDPAFRAKRRALLMGTLTRLNRYTLYAAAVLMILREFRIDVLSTIVPVGLAVGAVVLLALRRVLKDAAAGFVLLFEMRFGPGDLVTLNDVTGTVVDVDLRTTTLRLSSGDDVVLANGEILRIVRPEAGQATGPG
jgi:small conductance mechanosensitive channel